MDIEDHLLYMDENPDFKLFYKKLKVLKEWIISITIPIMCTKNLKSGYHYLTAFLLHCTSLKNLEIIGPTYT